MHAYVFVAWLTSLRDVFFHVTNLKKKKIRRMQVTESIYTIIHKYMMCDVLLQCVQSCRRSYRKHVHTLLYSYRFEYTFVPVNTMLNRIYQRNCALNGNSLMKNTYLKCIVATAAAAAAAAAANHSPLATWSNDKRNIFHIFPTSQYEISDKATLFCWIDQIRMIWFTWKQE